MGTATVTNGSFYNHWGFTFSGCLKISCFSASSFANVKGTGYLGWVKFSSAYVGLHSSDEVRYGAYLVAECELEAE